MRTLTIGLGLVLTLLVFAQPAFAQDSSNFISTDGIKYLALALTVFAAASAQSKVLTAALESMGRNPGASGQMFLPWLLGIVFIEALFVLTLLVAAGYM